MKAIDALIAELDAAAQLEQDEQDWLLARLTGPERVTLEECWPAWAHDGQMPPDPSTGSGGPGWRVWLMMAGRGFGKTRAGAEYVSAMARANGDLRIALVAATQSEVERVMVHGESGLMAVARFDEDLLWYPTRGLVEFASGARAFAYSGANPEGLRGPQHHIAWCDELAKWAYPQATWDNLMLGLRLGDGARALVTTTPRPIPLLRRLAAAPGVLMTRGRTADNLNLPEDFVADVTGLYEGTRLGRQELGGELIEDVEGALWTRAMIEKSRVGTATSSCPLARVVVGVDPPASASGDACGIVVCALGADGIGYVLADMSVGGLAPEGWARAVVRAAEIWEADRVIVETNQGGEMVESVLRSVDSALPVRPVKARFGKAKRAEPVSAFFARGKAKFAGAFPELEDELCGITSGGGYEGPGRSPDRADAMVWAMAELMLGKGKAPRVRAL
jgi:phage terminase large subunit-like protein